MQKTNKSPALCANEWNSAKQSCPYCGSTDMYQGPGAGPHYASLMCRNCDRQIKWLPKPKPPEAAGNNAANMGFDPMI